jgi:hypothetical protein
MIKFLLREKKEDGNRKAAAMVSDFVRRHSGHWSYDDWLTLLHDTETLNPGVDRSVLLEALEEEKMDYLSKTYNIDVKKGTKTEPAKDVPVKKDEMQNIDDSKSTAKLQQQISGINAMKDEKNRIDAEIEARRKELDSMSGKKRDLDFEIRTLQAEQRNILRSVEATNLELIQKRNDSRAFDEALEKRNKDLQFKQWELEKREATLMRKIQELNKQADEIYRKESMVRSREIQYSIMDTKNRASSTAMQELDAKLKFATEEAKKSAADLELKKQRLELEIRNMSMQVDILRSEEKTLLARLSEIQKVTLSSPDAIAQKDLELKRKEQMLLVSEQQLASSKLELEKGIRRLSQERKSFESQVRDEDIRTIVDRLNKKDEELQKRERELKSMEKDMMLQLHEVSKKQMHHYISMGLKKGVPEDEIRASLRQAGWHEKHIEEEMQKNNISTSGK